VNQSVNFTAKIFSVILPLGVSVTKQVPPQFNSKIL